MTAANLLKRASVLGLKLEVRADRLAVIPGDRVPPDLLDDLRQHKAELLVMLGQLSRRGWQALPPNNLPLVTIKPRPIPADRWMVVDYLLRQTCGKPGELTAWLVERENAYFEGPGQKWDCAIICYAAARDAACWQLQRTENDVWELLEGLRRA